MEKQVRDFFESGLSLLKPSLAPRVSEYSWSVCKKDLVAGLTVAAILIPNALGYAILAGLPPVMGLYAAIPAIMCAALWGSSSHVITGPVGIVSLLAAASLSAYATPLTPEYITLAIVLAFLAGLIQLSLGLFRLGILARLIPHSALVGFTNAAALIIAITQLPALLGLTQITQSGILALGDILVHTSEIHVLSMTLGMATIVTILACKYWLPVVPGSLIALVAGLILGIAADLETLGVTPIGYIPSGIPQFTFAAFSIPVMYLLFKQALLIALVGFVETYSIAQSIAKKTGERIHADRELVGQGMANVSAGLLGGFPVSGSFSGSALNVKNGAQTNIAGLVASGGLFCAVLMMSPFLAHMPRAILAGVVIAAVLQLIDIKAIRELLAISRTDGALACVTGIAALILRPDDALLIGITLGIALFVLRSMRLRMHEVGYHKVHGSLWTRESAATADLELFPHVLMVRFDTSLIFANADTLVQTVDTLIRFRLEEFDTPLRALVLNGAGLNYLDASGIDALRELHAHLKDRGIEIRYMLIKDSVYALMQKARILDESMYIHGPHELSAWARTI